MATILMLIGDIGERSTSWLTVSFFDIAGLPAIPDSVTYRVDDQGSGTAIRAATSLVTAAVITVKLSPTDNRILNSVNEYEYREITVQAFFGGADECNEHAVYRVKNLTFLS
jgi:hypothetical protein